VNQSWPLANAASSLGVNEGWAAGDVEVGGDAKIQFVWVALQDCG
jgi:hypothetical protein